MKEITVVLVNGQTLVLRGGKCGLADATIFISDEQNKYLALFPLDSVIGLWASDAVVSLTSTDQPATTV